MFMYVYPILSLLAGIGVLLMGLGLLATAMGIRAAAAGFQDSVIGIIMSAYFAGFILGTYVCPGVVRRVGHIRAYAVFAALASVCAFAHALIVHPVVWGVLRLVTGICLVGLYLVIESWLNSETPNERRGRIFAAYMTVTFVALALGQYMLLIDPEAGVTVFGIAAAFFSIGLIPVALTRLREPRIVGSPPLGLRHLVSQSSLGVGGALAAGMSTSAFWGMGAVFAQRIGLTGSDVVTFMSITILGGILLQWPIGKLSDHLDRRLVLLTIASVSTVAALATASAALWYHDALTICALMFGGAAFSIYSLSVAHVNDRLQPEHVVDASKGILLIFGIGAILGPMAAGLFMQFIGPAGAFVYIGAVLGLFTAFCIVRIILGSPVSQADRSIYLPMARTSQAAAELDPRGSVEQTPLDESIIEND
jgi:MFS family permease